MDHERYEREVGRGVAPAPPKKSEPGRTAWLISLKAGTPCTDCGRVFPPQVMQWDHKPEFEKIGNISQDFWNRTRDEVLAEISKCDLVCTNCHRIRTFTRAEWGRKWLQEQATTYDNLAVIDAAA